MKDFFVPPPSSSGTRYEFRQTPRQEWMGPPRGAVPAVVPAERVLARTQEVVISLGRLLVYPAGFEFEVSVDMKDEWSDLDPFEVGPPRRHEKDGELSPEHLRLGFRFASGVKVTSVGGESTWPAEPGPKTPVLNGRGGSRSGGHSDSLFWVWPLPPPGPLQLVCEWPAAEIPLTESELDAAAILAAAGRAPTIFEDKPE